MIDLNRIRSLKPLEEMKKDLSEFIALDPKVVIELYEEQYHWGQEDYEADLEQVKDLLEQVERRIKSLSNHIKKSKASAGKNAAHRQSGEKVSQASGQPS